MLAVISIDIPTRKHQNAADNKRSVTYDIWQLVKPDLLLLITVVITAVAAAVTNLMTPKITGELINIIAKSINEGSLVLNDLKEPAMKLLALFGMQGFLTFLHISLVSILGENMAKRLKNQLFSAIIRQDIAFFDKYRSGELVSRLTTDVHEFKHTFKQIITLGLKAVTQTIGSAVALLRISTSLTFTLCATMPVIYALLNAYGAYLRELSKRSRSIDAIASGIAGEGISNIRTVRAFAAETRETEMYSKVCRDVAKANILLGYNVGLFQGITNSTIGCMVLIVLYYGGSLVVKNEISGGDLMNYMISVQSTQKSLVSLGVLFGQTIKAAASANRVFEFIHTEPTIQLTGGIEPEHVKGDLEFLNVDFRYPTRPDQVILKNFSLRIPSGTMVALCGPSGSGKPVMSDLTTFNQKSTVAALIERFYDPDAGEIILDSVPLSSLDPSWLRRHIGYINQEPVLFATTIYENIRYGKPDATRKEVEEAARKANAADFIEGFPAGYETVLGERGVTLSGGQRQRIAIARAILKDPKILILDEATSALDQSEKLVQEALDKLMKGRTVVVIAHRLSTIQSADLIVVMGRNIGNVIEQGTHHGLLKKKGAYFRLYNQLAMDSDML
ncbi:1272_t:CDS:10 [Paraglomus occultum]|uniref:Mitochondrial potassium channel ATP-binding subunit n=1 Tax=Paraglomus occultum TaxID=144539 RepID=A0A9N9AT85_9GLOM|nr:1272_t:CDS:10 [Paraglomus occultum]